MPRSRLAATWAAVPLVTATLVVSLAGCGGKSAEPGRTLTPSPSGSTAATTSVTPSATGTAAQATGTPAGTATGSPGATTTTPSPGVTAVARSDREIRAGIIKRIAASAALTGVRVRVRVRQGVVGLIGQVKTAEQRRLVENIALTEPGVKKVLSYLTIEGANAY
jgi:osmotically-inducible protein OsmY